MGTRLTSWVERRSGGEYEQIDRPDLFLSSEPFAPPNYGVYAFLAGVRNYAGITPLSAPRGLPDDVRESVSKRYYSYPDVLHSASWFLVSELAEVDYCEVIEDRRERRVGSDRADFYQTNNTVALGKGEQMTLREFLGAEFFLDLDALTACNADRIVFWFEL